MESLHIYDFESIRTVRSVEVPCGNHDGEDHSLCLISHNGEYYLEYFFDPFPARYGEVRCDAVMHISEAESRMDNLSLWDLFFNTTRKYRIRRSTFQKERTLTCLCSMQHEQQTCFTWCSSFGRDDTMGGCVICSDEEAETLTEEQLLAVLKDILPEGTVIPEFRMDQYNKSDMIRSRMDEVKK